MASIERTAYPRLKRRPSARDLQEAFTPSDGEVEWARGLTRSEERWLALVVLLKCFQRLGYFPSLAEVPVVVVDHVRQQMKLPDQVAPIHESERSAKRHSPTVAMVEVGETSEVPAAR